MKLYIKIQDDFQILWDFVHWVHGGGGGEGFPWWWGWVSLCVCGGGSGFWEGFCHFFVRFYVYVGSWWWWGGCRWGGGGGGFRCGFVVGVVNFWISFVCWVQILWVFVVVVLLPFFCGFVCICRLVVVVVVGLLW